MGREIRDLTPANLDDVPRPCRACIFWELSPVDRAGCVTQDQVEFEKEAWCSEVALVAGSCGKVAYLDGRPVGYVIFGPRERFAGADVFPARVSRDALLLSVAYVLPEASGWGIGKALVRAVLEETVKRGKKAVEAYGDRNWEHPACLLPASFLEILGFRVKRDHPRFPLMRIDARALVKASESAESAVEQLLDSLKGPEPAVRPVGF